MGSVREERCFLGGSKKDERINSHLFGFKKLLNEVHDFFFELDVDSLNNVEIHGLNINFF